MKKINLSIPDPCHENWNKMTQADKGRFCASCQKTVIDFTNMSDRQIAEFFKKPSGSLCGRFQSDQLNRDIVIPRKRIPWIKYFFQFSLPAFLVSMKAGAQGKIEVKGEATVYTRTIGKLNVLPTEEIKELIAVKGKITNERGEAIPYATIMIKGTKTGTVSDATGDFILKSNKNEKIKLIVSCIGFQTREIDVINPAVNIVLNDATLETLVLGFVVPAQKTKPKIPVIKQSIDTAFKKFSVYPNPVQSNSVMKIDLKKLEKGNYTISLINMAGEVIQTEEVTIQNKNSVIDLPLKETAAGTYFIHVFNRKTAASCSEKIVVQ